MTKWLAAIAVTIGAYTAGVHSAEGAYADITRENNHAVEVCEARYRSKLDVAACVTKRLID